MLLILVNLELICLNYVCHHIDCVVKLEDDIGPTKHHFLKEYVMHVYIPLEDEYHFVLECSLHINLRRKNHTIILLQIYCFVKF